MGGQAANRRNCKAGLAFFAFQRFIVPSLDTLAAQLKAEGHLRGLSADNLQFVPGIISAKSMLSIRFGKGTVARNKSFFVRSHYGPAIGSLGQISRANRCTRSFERADSSGLAAVINIAIRSPDPQRSDERAALAVKQDRNSILQMPQQS
ncbi:MAG: hypothetical protein NVS1B2_27590 [Vulcanimicrobiaceae bacterium]